MKEPLPEHFAITNYDLAMEDVFPGYIREKIANARREAERLRKEREDREPTWKGIAKTRISWK